MKINDQKTPGKVPFKETQVRAVRDRAGRLEVVESQLA